MVTKETNPSGDDFERAIQNVAIDELTETILTKYEKQLQSFNIRVDKDLPSLSANIYPRFIHAAVSQLIENAIDQMASGGELNVTLVEGDRCWELEVADSMSFPMFEDRGAAVISPVQSLPKIVAAEKRSRLELAHRAAQVHGGHVQSWDCPQGGTANVLVIPRRQKTQTSA